MTYVGVSGSPAANWFRPAAYGLGQPTPTLSAGQFGLAMSRITIPAEAVRLLRLSSTFRGIAQTLDGAYVDHRRWIELREKNPGLKLNQQLRVASGGLQGRRILYVGADPAGSLFIRGQSIESPTGWDIIRFNDSLSHDDTIPWVEAVAHESAHAFARVTATGSAPANPVARVRVSVRDECEARRVEHRIVAEIRATAAGRTALRSHPLPRPVHECDCERDWFPVAQKRTYLEHFVLGSDWESAASPLSTQGIEQITTDIAAIPLLAQTGSRKQPTLLKSILLGTGLGTLVKQFPILQSPAAQAAFVLRVVDESWRELIAAVGETFPAFPGVKERRLLRHAQLFFKIPVTYTTKCPRLSRP